MRALCFADLVLRSYLQRPRRHGWSHQHELAPSICSCRKSMGIGCNHNCVDSLGFLGMKCKSTRSRVHNRASQHTKTVTNLPGHSWVSCRNCMHNSWIEGVFAPGLHVSMSCKHCGKHGEIWIAQRSQSPNPAYEEYQKAKALGRAQ